MSTPTSQRWFVPDPQYYRATGDYAVLGESRSAVQQITTSADDHATHYFRQRCMLHDYPSSEELDSSEAPEAPGASKTPGTRITFRDMYLAAKHAPHYSYAEPGRLLYADVNAEDGSHEAWVRDTWAVEAENEEGPDTVAVKEALLAYLKGKWRETNEDQWVDDAVAAGIRDGHVDPDVVDYILGAAGKEEKNTLMRIVSGQTRQNTIRPVLLLVGLVENMQAAVDGETKGWVMGYDLVEGRLIVKPFEAKPGKLPLSGKWDTDAVDDGICFAGKPAEFAQGYLALDGKGKSVQDGFQMLVWSLAAKWIYSQWDGLAKEDQDLSFFTADTRERIRAHGKNLAGGMNKLEYPAAHQTSETEKVAVEPFVFTQEMLALEEDAVRSAAVAIKQSGKEKVAENAAAVYERLSQMLAAFNKDPEADL